MRRPILLTAGLAAALGHFACDDSTAPPLSGSTGATPGASTGGTNANAGGTQSGSSGGSTASGGMSGANCGTMTGSGPINAQFGVLTVTRNGQEYIVQNNVWGNGTAQQNLQVNGTSFTVSRQTGDNSGSYEPVSYPSIFIGSNNTHTSANSGLPRAVTSLNTIPTSLSHNADGSVAGIYNAAYDVWFSTTSAGDTGSPSGGYLMVWLYRPTQKQPVGGIVSAGQAIPGVDGTWDIYTCIPSTSNQCSNNKPVISYVRTPNTTSMTFDLKAFISHAMATYPANVPSGWFLSNIFGGFEIWSGGVGLDLACFYASVG